jgi:hypothetical protein
MDKSVKNPVPTNTKTVQDGKPADLSDAREGILRDDQRPESQEAGLKEV